MKFKEQLIFWSMAFLCLLLVFGSEQGQFTHAFFFTCMLFPVAIGTSLFFNEFLVPNYLIKGRIPKFILYFIYLTIVSIWLQLWVIVASFALLANYKFSQMNPIETNVKLLTILIYLLVLIQAFFKMVQEFKRAKLVAAELALEVSKSQQAFLLLRANRKNFKVGFDEILYIESLSDYVKVVLKDGKDIITKETISNLETRLPKSFLRIHRSFIISTNDIISFTQEIVQIENHTIPVGRKYKGNLNKIYSKGVSEQILNR